MGLFSGRRAGDNPPEWLILGLGNPGSQYEHTRHNIGEHAVRALANSLNANFKSGKNDAWVAETRVGEHRIVLGVPITFMNESGRAAASLIKRFGLGDVERLVVVHDELDLEPGVVRVKSGGGLAGHNGLRSIAQHVSSQDFTRIRIGVGRPPSADRGADWVLSKVPQRDREMLNVGASVACEAVELIVAYGIEAAMRSVNSR